jgi:serine/threonine protein kinase/tetratricopeptide (TPR) repeat protein
MGPPGQITGQVLGHYRVMERIGGGGMGVVFRAHDERLNRDVALKVLPAGSLSDESARKRFRKEALTLSRLNHPNIETVYDFDTQDGVDFLVMELIAGATLDRRLSGGPLPEKDVLVVGEQIAKALEEAHDHGILHRDLKPANLMVTTKGQVKVLDFGLAKLLRISVTALTESLDEMPGVAGTLPYMAPEQLRGEPPDFRSDLYALGAVLYEMATGQRPFPQLQPPQLIASILNEDPRPPSKLNRQTSPALESIILKALEKDVEHRYQSAKDLCVDLEGLAPSSSVRQPAGGSGRRRYRLRVALILFLVLLALAYRYVWTSKRPAEPKQVLVGDLENRTGDPDFDDSLGTALSTYLEQSHLVNIFPVTRERAAVQALGLPADARIEANLGSEICVREGIPLLITGEINRLKDQYVLAVRIINPANQKVLSVHSANAPEKNAVLAALGSMARELRSDIGEQRVSIQQNDRLLEQVTTSSLPALQLYSLGRKEHLRGNYEAAIPLYKNATRLDVDFALAYAWLSTVHRDLGDSTNARLYMNKALTLLDHVTERERYTLLGLSAAYDEDYEQGIDNFLVLTRLYPEDSNGHFYLTLCYLLKGDFEHAYSEAKIAAGLDPSPSAYTNLAEVLLAQNRFQEVIDLLKVSPAIEAEGGLARAYIGLGHIEKAQEAVDKLLLAKDERIRAKAAITQVEIWLFSGRWRQAEKFLNETVLLGTDQYPLRDLILAALAMQRADSSRVRQLLGNVEEKVRPSDGQSVSVGVLLSQAHESRLSHKLLREIEVRRTGRNVRRLQAYDNLLHGVFALDEGHAKAALPFLKSARADWDDVQVRTIYARALFENARWPEAQKEFEGVLEQKGRALGDPAALILWKLSPYWIGRSLQAQGDAAASQQMYRAFLGAWPSSEQYWLATQDAARRLRQVQ